MEEATSSAVDKRDKENSKNINDNKFPNDAYSRNLRNEFNQVCRDFKQEFKNTEQTQIDKPILKFVTALADLAARGSIDANMVFMHSNEIRNFLLRYPLQEKTYTKNEDVIAEHLYHLLMAEPVQSQTSPTGNNLSTLAVISLNKMIKANQCSSPGAVYLLALFVADNNKKCISKCQPNEALALLDAQADKFNNDYPALIFLQSELYVKKFLGENIKAIPLEVYKNLKVACSKNYVPAMQTMSEILHNNIQPETLTKQKRSQLFDQYSAIPLRAEYPRAIYQQCLRDADDKPEITKKRLFEIAKGGYENAAYTLFRYYALGHIKKSDIPLIEQLITQYENHTQFKSLENAIKLAQCVTAVHAKQKYTNDDQATVANIVDNLVYLYAYFPIESRKLVYTIVQKYEQEGSDNSLATAHQMLCRITDKSIFSQRLRQREVNIKIDKNIDYLFSRGFEYEHGCGDEKQNPELARCYYALAKAHGHPHIKHKVGNSKNITNKKRTPIASNQRRVSKSQENEGQGDKPPTGGKKRKSMDDTPTSSNTQRLTP